MEAKARRRIDPRRRERILDGVLQAIAVHGVEGLTHRRVADAAKVPVAATTYYFTTLEEMLEAALRAATERDIAMLRVAFADAALTDVPALLLGYVQTALREDRARLVVLAELYVAALRRPVLRDLVKTWEQTWAELLMPAYGAAAGTVSTSIGGVLIRALVLDEDHEATAGLSILLESLRRSRTPARGRSRRCEDRPA
jgi:DNA-binding transcriptional regulator YbjK